MPYNGQNKYKKLSSEFPHLHNLIKLLMIDFYNDYLNCSSSLRIIVPTKPFAVREGAQGSHPPANLVFSAINL